jgi:tRNA (cytidine/uridine-2'-O-)-methyltransferase
LGGEEPEERRVTSSAPHAAEHLALALYQPDIAQNAGTLLRMCACLDVEAALIGPAGFAWGDRSLRRAGMDYLDHVTLSRHACFEDFEAWRLEHRPPRRLVLLTTKSPLSYLDVQFREGDVLMVGRESAGVPEEVAAKADIAVSIPMKAGMRSLNVAIAAAMVLGEALRQLRGA